MTTGNVSVDLRALYGVLRYGPTAKRVWSGIDSPAPPPKRYMTLHEPFESSLLRSDGKPFVIPAYRVRVNTPSLVRRRGENPLSYSVEKATSVVWQFPSGYSGFGDVQPGVHPSEGLSYTPSWNASDDIILLNRLRARMVGSQFNPAAFLATSSQTLGMLAEVPLKIDRMYRLVRKGRIRDAAFALTSGTSTKFKKGHRNGAPPTTPGQLANAQLELSYGWLPLLSDAYEGAQYIAHNTQLPMRQTYRARFSRPLAVTTTSPSTQVLLSQECVERGQYVARVQEDFAFSLAYLSGFDDPASMVWERLPWSFIADWFIPVQNYLLARSFARNVVGTFVLSRSNKFNIVGARQTNFGPPSATFGSYSYRATVLSRTVSSTLAVPLPKPKDLRSVPSWRRALNSVSLLVQRHGSSPS